MSCTPVGGCSTGKGSSEGAVNSFGEVFKVENTNVVSTIPYGGLYVIEESIIPDSLGVNPSLTITALALTIAKHKFAGDDMKNLPL